jgi:hypothetical protein
MSQASSGEVWYVSGEMLSGDTNVRTTPDERERREQDQPCEEQEKRWEVIGGTCRSR